MTGPGPDPPRGEPEPAAQPAAQPAAPPDLARWLAPGERVLWSDVARPAVLGWPPRSPWGLVLLALTVSGLLMSAGVAAVAWRDATGQGLIAAPAIPLTLGAAALLAAGIMAVLTLTDPPRRYALVQGQDGALAGYLCEVGLALRFALPADPRLPEVAGGGERADLDWGELEAEELPAGRVARVPVRWTDVAYPQVVLELTARARSGSRPPG